MPAKKSPSATSAATKKPASKPATKPAGARAASGSGTGAGGTKASGTKAGGTRASGTRAGATKAGATSAARPEKKARPAPAPGANVVVTDVVETPASRAAATRPVVVALRPDATGSAGQQPGSTDTTITLPFTGWRVTVPTLPALPTLPDEITLPVVGWTVNATEREAIAYYAVLGGLVAIQVVEWPLAALFVAGHVLARHTHYKGLEGAVEALEEA